MTGLPLHRHVAFYMAASVGFAGFLGGQWFKPQFAITIGADIFFVLYLVLVLTGFSKLTPAYLRENADRADEPVWIIFLVTIATIVVALVSLFILINRRPIPDVPSLVLTLASVPLGWFTIQTMAALHYAHLYWRPEITTDESGRKLQGVRRGLDFPGTREPGGPDFLYISYVVGMTAQTSDVGITTTGMRTVCLTHAVLSFFYNTVLVAAAVNVVVSLKS